MGGEGSRIEDYRGLRVWQDAMTLVEVIYGLTQRFPPEERFGLCHQIRRAAVSVPSCVAEGNARGSTRDYLRFIHMAMGSLAELETQLEIGRRLGFAAQEDLQRALTLARELTAGLQALKRSLQRRLDARSPDGSLLPVPRSHG